MLALICFRYWWLRPLVPDPQDLETLHSNRRSGSMTSVLEPVHSPQYDVIQYWSKITSSALDPMQRSAAEIEGAIAKGKDMILVEPSIAGHVYAHYLSHGWLVQENIVFYSSIGLFASKFFPKTWFVYVPCSILALMHSWLYFKVYKYDRLSQYQAYDDDRHPISNLITAWVLGHRPDHFQYVLKKERVIVWEIISELTMYSSIISTLLSLQKIEESVVGSALISTLNQASPLTLPSLVDLLSLPAYSSGYFQPHELLPASAGTYLPTDIPNVTGWFDLPQFNFRLKPMKYDLAIIICGMGGYFTYKLCEHLFRYNNEEIDGMEREWSHNDHYSQTGNKEPFGMELTTKSETLLDGGTGNDRSRIRKNLKLQEEYMIAQISGQVPYGWVAPGYTDNHYGVFV